MWWLIVLAVFSIFLGVVLSMKGQVNALAGGGLLILLLGYILVAAGPTILIVYVLIHFISKYW